MGLLDALSAQDDSGTALRQGLLSAGLAMMAGSQGKGYTPSLGAILGQGGLVGLDQYNSTANNLLAQQAAKTNEAFRQFQLQQLQAQADRQKKIQDTIASANDPLSVGAAQGDVGPTVTNAARMNQPVSLQQQLQNASGALARGGFLPEAAEYATSAAGMAPKPLIVDKDKRVLDPTTYKTLVGAAIDPNEPFYTDEQGNVRPNPAYQEYAIRKAAAGSTRVNVPVSLSTEKAYGGAFADKIAAQDSTLYDAAQSAPQIIERAQRIKQLLDGKAYTGSGAGFKLAFGKAAKTVGLNYAGDTIANTEELAADLARNTLAAIKTSGLGGGNGFTDKDREFLEKAVGGKIELDSGTLRRLADMSIRSQQITVKKWNDRAKQIPQSALTGTGIGPVPTTEQTTTGWKIERAD